MPTRPPVFAPTIPKAPRHQPKEANRQATRALSTGSKAWQQIRQQVLVRDGYRCRVCAKLVTGKDAHVDHRFNDAAINPGYDLETLWLLCASCHSSKTRTEQNGGTFKPKGCGVDGWPHARTD